MQWYSKQRTPTKRKTRKEKLINLILPVKFAGADFQHLAHDQKLHETYCCRHSPREFLPRFHRQHLGPAWQWFQLATISPIPYLVKFVMIIWMLMVDSHPREKWLEHPATLLTITTWSVLLQYSTPCCTQKGAAMSVNSNHCPSYVKAEPGSTKPPLTVNPELLMPAVSVIWYCFGGYWPRILEW